jgi:hypothetical protein
MRAVAGLEDGTVRTGAGSPLGEAFPAVFAFVTRTGAGRAGDFDRDPPPGPMTEDDPGQSLGDDEPQVENDGRNA